jgi:hypothetical protein
MNAKTFTTAVEYHGSNHTHHAVGFPADTVTGAFVSLRIDFVGGMFVSRCLPEDARAIANAILKAANHAASTAADLGEVA